MKIVGNIVWLIFGGLETSIGYFTASLVLALTIVGLPWALQTFKIGLLCLWPFGSTITESSRPIGCISLFLNVLWIIFGGLWSWICHLFFGLLLCVTIVGLPWGRQHFKMARLALAPFGKEVSIGTR